MKRTFIGCLWTAFLLGFAFMWTWGSQVEGKSSATSYVFAQKGTLPIVISTPHNGTKSRPGLPERTNPFHLLNFYKLADMHTQKISRGLADELEKITGKRPYLVVNLLHRKYMDPNRSPKQAYEHKLAKEVYHLYHNQLRLALKQIRKKYGQGLLLDIHGQTRLPNDIYLGTAKGKTLKHLAKQYGSRRTFGKYWLGNTLRKQGYSLGNTRTAKKLTGGYIVRHHSLESKYYANTTQVEIHRRIRYSKKKRAKFIRDLAQATNLFYQAFLKKTRRRK